MAFSSISVFFYVQMSTARRRLRNIFEAQTSESSIARVGRAKHPRRPEERGSVRNRKTSSDHCRQQLHDQIVYGKPTFQEQWYEINNNYCCRRVFE